MLWPFLLKMIIPRIYTGAVATVGYAVSICDVNCMSRILSQESTDVVSLSSGVRSSSYKYFRSYCFDIICRFAGAFPNCAGINTRKVI